MNFTVFSHTSTFYGAPQSIFMLSNELRHKGHQVNFVLPDSNGLFYNKLLQDNYPVTILPNPSWVVAERKPGYSKWFYFKHKVKKKLMLLMKYVKSFSVYEELLKKNNTDCIIVNTSVAPFGLLLGKRLKIKTIIFVREVLGNKDMNLKLNVPRFIVKASLKNTSQIIGPSNYIGNYFNTKYDVESVIKLGNPIKIDSDSQIHAPEINHSNWSFGLVGSLSVNKGQAEFIKEAVKINNAVIHVFGEGNDNILHFIDEQKQIYPEKLKVYGFVNDLESIYTQFDYYINLGKNESFGRTTIEAMSAGCIVFGRRSGATPELINHGVNGFLFDDISEVFDLLNQYHSEGRQMELRAIQNNAIEFSKQFSCEKIGKQFLSILSPDSGFNKLK